MKGKSLGKVKEEDRGLITKVGGKMGCFYRKEFLNG
jgi:hypothetical protein